MAAARARGELPLTIEGESYVLSLKLGAMADLEELHDRTLSDVAQGMGRGRVRDLLLFLWVALRTRHPELACDDWTAAKARLSEFVERAGGIDAITTQIHALAQLHERPAELGAEGNGNGTGPGSPRGAEAGESESRGAVSASVPSAAA